VVTKPFQLPHTARSLHINALADDGGSIEVTLWAERGSNFTIVGKAVPIASNSVDHTLVWEHGNDVVERASQMGKLQLRLALRNAKIFSYWFEEDPNPSPSPRPSPSPNPSPSCKGVGAQCVAMGSLNNSKMWFHPKDSKFIDSWISDCCPGLMCRLGSKVGDWRCSNSTVHTAGPLQVVVRGPKKLPAKLPTNRTVLGLQSYESSIARFSSGELLLAYFADRDSTCEQRRGNGCGLALRRSMDSGGSFEAPEYHPDLAQIFEEWSIHILQNDTVLLSFSNGGLFRSVDRARTFQNISIPSSLPVLPEGHERKCGVGSRNGLPIYPVNSPSFGCSGWSIIEVPPMDPYLPAGLYHFGDVFTYHSITDGQSWTLFATAAGHMARTGGAYKDEFFAQSGVYRRRDGTFLHSTRWNTAFCDEWAGGQLWHSNDTNASAWRCVTQAAGGICNPGTKLDCFSASDVPAECTDASKPMFLKPGNHFSHWLRLKDGRLLLSWTHRSGTIDDDGWGTGNRAIISYDDGETFEFNSDYIVISAQSDNFCADPWCCAPAKGGCNCFAGYGNTIQLDDGSLVTVTFEVLVNDTGWSSHQFQTVVTRWRLPPLKTDDRGAHDEKKQGGSRADDVAIVPVHNSTPCTQPVGDSGDSHKQHGVSFLSGSRSSGGSDDHSLPCASVDECVDMVLWHIPGPNPVISPGLGWTNELCEMAGGPYKLNGSTYALLYHCLSGNATLCDGMCVGVSFAEHPLGPWTAPEMLPILRTGAGVQWDNKAVASLNIMPDTRPGREGQWLGFYEGSTEESPYWHLGVVSAPHPLGPWTRFEGNPVLNGTATCDQSRLFQCPSCSGVCVGLYLSQVLHDPVLTRGEWWIYLLAPINENDEAPIALWTSSSPTGPFVFSQYVIDGGYRNGSGWDAGRYSGGAIWIDYETHLFHLFLTASSNGPGRTGRAEKDPENIGYAVSEDGVTFREGTSNPIGNYSGSTPSTQSMAEARVWVEGGLVYVYHTIRWLDKSDAFATVRNYEDIGVEVFSATPKFQLAVPLISADWDLNLPAGVESPCAYDTKTQRYCKPLKVRISTAATRQAQSAAMRSVFPWVSFSVSAACAIAASPSAGGRAEQHNVMVNVYQLTPERGVGALIKALAVHEVSRCGWPDLGFAGNTDGLQFGLESDWVVATVLSSTALNRVTLASHYNNQSSSVSM
jgi:hypothetical protein